MTAGTMLAYWQRKAAVAEELIACVRALHYRRVLPLRRDRCAECGLKWPCPTATIVG